MSTSKRATATVLACAWGVAVASLATSASPRDAGSASTALPDTVAHPPLARLYPLPADRQDTVVVRSIGMRITPLAQTSFYVPTFDDGTIPGGVLAAYRRAAEVLSERDPSCNLHWSVIAGIGRIESGHAYGGALLADGRTATPILGPRLDGSLAGTATIPDSTGGRFDGDPVWERAVGPMQFLPSTWLSYGQDGNGDGVRDPHNVYDAALGAAVYLCAGERDLSRPADLRQALFSYNPSLEYVRAVLAWADHYAGLGPRPGAGHPVAYTLAASRVATVDRQDAPKPKPDDAPVAPSPEPTGPQRPDSGDSTNTPPPPSSGEDPATPEPTEPTESPAPNKPTQPSGPSEPTGPTEPAEPTPPTAPVDEPTEPTEPAAPTEPAEPTEPVDPTEPAEPDDPVCEQPDDESNTEETPAPADQTTEPVETEEAVQPEDTTAEDPADPETAPPCELPDEDVTPEPATEPETAPSVQPGE